MLRLIFLGYLVALACAGELDRRTSSGDRLSRERLLADSDKSFCFWEGDRCTLTSDFVGMLPGRLGAASTRSARVIASAALRAVACANFTGQPECLAAVSYNCKWDAISSSCGLADLLDIDNLNGVAYCPGSRMEAAVNCTLLTDDGEEACKSSQYNCTTVQVTRLADGVGSAAGGLGDRLYDIVANTMLGVVVKSDSGADQLTSAIMALLGNLPIPLQLNTTKACVPRWATESSTADSIFRAVRNAIQGRTDVLSQLLSEDLLGNCEGVQELRSTVRACPDATSRVSCEAFKGCGWQDVGQACTVTADLLPSLVLDPTDSWVKLLDKASEACGNVTDAVSCANTDSVKAVLNDLGNTAGISTGGDTSIGSGSAGSVPVTSGGAAPYGNGGGDGGGAVASRGALPLGSLLALAVAAIMGAEAIRWW